MPLPDKLIDDNLNIKELFENDKERIGSSELIALKYIARKAYDGNFFDISEIGEQISETTIESLRDKRLIIRSGANYNIYWDIFRDYIVTNEVPPIGESYILRQGVNLCLEVFLLFKDSDTKMSLDSILQVYPRRIGRKTLENILIELRNVGLVQKLESEEYYKIARKDIKVTKEGFINFITSKFKNYTPILKLAKSNQKDISKEDITNTLKETFKYEFKAKTWDIYTNTLTGWIQMSNLEVKKKLLSSQKGNRKLRSGSVPMPDTYMIRSSQKELISTITKIKEGQKINNDSAIRDLFILGICDANRHLTEKGKNIGQLESNEALIKLKNLVLNLPKIKKIKQIIRDNNNLSPNDYLQIIPNDLFGDIKDTTKKKYIQNAISWLE